MLPQPLLTVSQLSFERDDNPLFRDVSFSLNSGDILQIEGANGSGKTTLLRLLTTTLKAQSGEISYRGVAIADSRYDYLSDIFYLGHQPAIKKTLTPEENLRWAASNTVAPDPESIARVLVKVGLSGYEDVPCYTLSAGQMRRVALARLLLSNATLWFLDEPYTAIDKQGVSFLEQCMAEHVASGGAIVLSTHQDIAIDGVSKYQLKPAVEEFD